MAFTTITQGDIADKGVVGMPDKPDLTTLQMQQKLDELATDVIIPKHNGLIAELEAGAAGASIGVMDGATATNLQDRLDGIDTDVSGKIDSISASSAIGTDGNVDLEYSKGGTLSVLSIPVTGWNGVHKNTDSLDSIISDSDTIPFTAGVYGNKNITFTNFKSSLRLAFDFIYGTVKNAFKSVKVGTTTITANGEDLIEFVAGDNITLTPNATNKTITIASTGGGGGASSADDVSYDNTTSGLTATNVQDAIDEVYGDMPAEPTVYTQTLAAGNTSVAFTDVATTASSVVEVGTSVAGLDYNSISVSGTTYTVSFDAQASNVTIYLIVSEI